MLSQGKPAVVAIVGYPNTGKSSVINALSSSKRVGFSSESGFTKGFQYIRIDSKIKLIDTPGIIPFSKKNETLLALFGGLDAEKVKDPVGVAYSIINSQSELLTKYYGLSDIFGVYGQDSVDPEKFLNQLSKKLNYLTKRAQPDINRAAKTVIRDWQSGKMHLIAMKNLNHSFLSKENLSLNEDKSNEPEERKQE